MAKVIKYCLVIGAILLLQDIIIKRCGVCLFFGQISITYPIKCIETCREEYCNNGYLKKLLIGMSKPEI